MIPSEFKQLKDLRLVDDQGLKPEMLMLLEADTESVSVLLSQLKSYILDDIENSLNPVGSPIPWPNDNIPTGYAKINDGLTFDIIKFPRTALAWPSGVIPPHKGLVIECTADGAVNGDTEEGEVKKINATISVDNHQSVKLTTTSNGKHKHKQNLPVGGGGTQNIESLAETQGNDERVIELYDTNETPDHNHQVTTPEYSHSATFTHNGAVRNTVDRINYNMIVRLA